MNRPSFMSLLAAPMLLATATVADAQQATPMEPRYVDTGRDFRQADQVTMGANLLTPEEEKRFAALRQQAKTRADLDRVEAEQSALLNQRVAERINAALARPIGPELQQGPEGAPARSSQ